MSAAAPVPRTATTDPCATPRRRRVAPPVRRHAPAGPSRPRRGLSPPRARRGSVAALVAVAVVPLILAVGLGLDLVRLYALRSRLMASVDAAALAAARDPGDRAAQAEAWFWANFTRRVQRRPDGREVAFGYLGSTVGELTAAADPADPRVARVAARATLPTAVMHLAGIETVSVTAEAAALRQDRGMELALVLDVTGSMASNNAIAALRDAATGLVNKLYGRRETVPNLWVSVVPFTAAVNIGRARSAWLAPGSLDPAQYDPAPWRGCVEARHERGLDRTDAPPAEAPFRPYLWRSTVGAFAPNLGDNEWTRGRITEPNPENPPSDAALNALDNGGVGPNLGCPRAITGLTASRSAVLGEIAALRATRRGGTMANLGLQMGWATLSPRWRGLWGGATPAALPGDYGHPVVDKVLILMTDGENQWFDWDGGQPGACRTTGAGAPCRPGTPQTPADGDYTGYGRLAWGRLNADPEPGTPAVVNNATALAQINARMRRLCSRIKDSGVTVYTVLFNLPAGATAVRDLYRSCATGPEYYFDSGSQTALAEAFDEIGNQLATLRLIR